MYLVYCAAVYLLQRKFLFPRHLIEISHGPGASPNGAEVIWIQTQFGKVESWYLPPVPKESNRKYPLLIFAHGNGEIIDYFIDEMTPFTKLGIGVLMVEYPGYGRSEGSPSQQSIKTAFTEAYDVMTHRPDIDQNRIVFYGRSLGGGAVSQLSLNRKSAAMILASSFTDVSSFLTRYLIPDFLVRDPFDSLAAISNYHHPTLIIHGEKDTIVPYDHGVKLFKASIKAKLITYDCGHNDCPPDWNSYWQDVASFLKKSNII